jgi:hypothetical protein
MRKEFVGLICVLALAISVSAQVEAIDHNRPTDDHEHPPSRSYGAAGEQEHEKKQKYTCPMHPEVVMEHPGNCPKCGMKLVPIKEKKRRTPNVQRSTSNGEGRGEGGLSKAALWLWN